MKKLVSLILVCGIVLLPSMALARIGLVPITQIMYTDLGDTTGGQLSSGKLLVKTVRMSGMGVVNCGSHQGCLDSGLDGIVIDIRQKLRIVINFTEGSVNGSTEGRIIAVELDAGNKLKFKGKVDGQVACVGSPQKPCSKLALDILLRARIVDTDQKNLAGVLEFKLTGILSAGDGNLLLPIWTSIGGDGTLALFFSSN